MAMSIAGVLKIVPGLLRCLGHRNVPLRSKALIVLGIVYLLCPVDLLPDFIPVTGWLDDLVVVPLLGWFAFRSLPADERDRLSNPGS